MASFKNKPNFHPMTTLNPRPNNANCHGKPTTNLDCGGNDTAFSNTHATSNATMQTNVQPPTTFNSQDPIACPHSCLLVPIIGCLRVSQTPSFFPDQTQFKT